MGLEITVVLGCEGAIDNVYIVGDDAGAVKRATAELQESFVYLGENPGNEGGKVFKQKEDD